MVGKGKYDEECVEALNKTQAVGVALIVVGGNKGSGFSLTCSDANVVLKLPAMLRYMAEQIDKDMQHGEGLSA